MTLLLTRADLAPFFEDPRSIETCMEAVIEAYLEPPADGGAPGARLAIPLGAGGQDAMVTVSASPRHGAIVQLRPRPERTPPPDSRLVLYAREGRVLAIMSAEQLDLVRVAASSAVAARRLAPAHGRVLAVLGSGIQGRAHARALRQALGATDVRVYSPTREHREALAAELGITAAQDARSAVEGADVIAAAASSDTPAFEAAWVRPGALIVSIARGQLPSELASSARIFVTLPPGGNARREWRGRDPGAPLDDAWTTVTPAGTIGDVLAGRVPARVREDETVLYMQMGLPGLEAALAERAYRWARERGAGREFSFS